jgi:hypothetical protein
MQPTHIPWWGKIGLLWLIFVPLCMAIYVLAQPLAPHDFWYHLRAGAWMVNHRGIPQVALFTPSVPPGTPYFYQSWMSEVLMYLIFKWSGLAGSQVVRAVCFAGSLAGFVAVAQHRAKVLLQSPGNDRFNQAARLVAVAALVGMAMCMPNTDLRPQAFSLPFFAIFAAIVFTWAENRGRRLIVRVVLLVVLMALWANTHGAFAIGLILLSLFCVGETLHFGWGKVLSPWLGERLSKSQLALAWGAFVGSVATACLNPHGWGIYAYVLELTGNVINVKYNQEWQPPTWNDGVDALFFCCGMAIVVTLLLLAVRHYEKKRSDSIGSVKSTFGVFGLRPGELLITAGFFVMALRSVRSILWFALLFVVICAALLCRLFPSHQNQDSEHVPASLQRCNAVLALFLCCLVIPFLPRFKPLLPWPASYWKRFALTPQEDLPDGFRGEPQMLLSNITPVGAAAFLRQSPPRGLLWNDMVLGSYLVWALYPAPGPWADPRIELRPDSFWMAYMDTCHAKNWPAQTLPRRGFSDVLINKDAAFEKPLQLALQDSPGWKIVFKDRFSLLFRYNSTK